jgi:hypothetical protein
LALSNSIAAANGTIAASSRKMLESFISPPSSSCGASGSVSGNSGRTRSAAHRDEVPEQ